MTSRIKAMYYFVPYCVASYSAAKNELEKKVGNEPYYRTVADDTERPHRLRKTPLC